MLVRCLYASRAVAPLRETVIEAILEKSRQKNPRLGVTGLLCYSGDIFIQVLEGGRDAVCELFNEIVRDERHTNVRILLFDEIASRKFGGWTMGQANVAKAQTVVLKHSEKPQLDPFVGSGAATLAILTELLESGAITSRCR